MKDVGIIGSGLVGPLLAVGLKKLGFNVTLYEKRSDARKNNSDQGRSINLVITRKGITALEKLGLWDEVRNITVPVYGRMMHSLSGELTYQPYGTDNSERNYSVSRSQLNYKLIEFAENVGVNVNFESEVESIDLDTGLIKFKNDESQKHDIVIGSDGAGSIVRKEFEKKQLCTSRTDYLGVNYKELLMPTTKDGTPALDKDSLHIWPRNEHMLMALPNLDDSFTMTLYLPDKGKVSFEENKDPLSIEKLFKTFYKDSIDLMPDYIDEFISNPVGKLGTVRCDKWNFKNKALIIGDASHAIVPFFGQGMNSGFEDVYVLINLLENKSSIEQAFEDFFQKQKPNADAIADMAIENYYEMAEKVGDEKFLFRKKVEQELTKKFGEKYISRYRLIVYTNTSYSEAKRIGVIQEKILDELCSDIRSLNDLNFNLAEKLIDEKLNH